MDGLVGLSIMAVPYGVMPLSEVQPKNGKHFTLDELRRYVRWGYDESERVLIEIIRLDEDWVLVVDEEGKLKDLPMNMVATGFLRGAYPYSKDYIVGNALLTSTKYIK